MTDKTPIEGGPTEIRDEELDHVSGGVSLSLAGHSVPLAVQVNGPGVTTSGDPNSPGPFVISKTLP